MTEVNRNHAFVSGKADSFDTSLVSSSEWNAPLVATNGSNGFIAMSDASSSTGEKWIQGPSVSRIPDTYSGGIASGNLSSTLISSNGNTITLLMVEAGAITADTNPIAVRLKEDGVEVAQWAVEGVTGHVRQVGTYYVAGTTGSKTYSLQITKTGGNVTSSNVCLTTLTLGRF